MRARFLHRQMAISDREMHMKVDQEQRSSAKLTLKGIMKDRPHHWFIHYSCESFYDRPDGTSPRITSIAIRNLDSGQTVSFSIHMMAERNGVALEDISAHYDATEKAMLMEYAEFLKQHQKDNFVHWNMRDANYGFAAIEHRTEVLGGESFVLGDERKIDLSRILSALYGSNYADHPRFASLIAMNENLKPKDMLKGEEEAIAFDNGNFVGLHQSTLRKVQLLTHIAENAYNGTLKTNAKFWDVHGGVVRGTVEAVRKHWVVWLVLTILSTSGAIFAFLAP